MLGVRWTQGTTMDNVRSISRWTTKKQRYASSSSNSNGGRTYFLLCDNCVANPDQIRTISNNEDDLIVHFQYLHLQISIYYSLIQPTSSSSNVNAQNDYGKTPLHLSIKQQNTEIIELLLGAGATCAIRDNNGQTVVHIAAKSNNLQVLKLLSTRVESDFNVKDKLGENFCDADLINP